MPGRRSPVVFAALLVLPLPACIHISAPAPPVKGPDAGAPAKSVAEAPTAPKPQPAPPAAPKAEFAVLPRVPGTVAPLRPAPGAPPPRDTTAQKPAGPVRAATGTEPGAFPLTQFPGTPEPPLLAAARAYAENRPERAIELLRGLDRSNQDFVLSVLPALARGATADLSDPVTAAVLVDQLQSAARRLEHRAALRVERALFCHHIEAFGRFTPRPAADPYRPHERAKLYIELRNLGSRPEGPGFVTALSAVVEVRDANNRLVDQIDPTDPTARRRVGVVKFDKQRESLSPLHDFHTVYEFSVPPAPGVYTITFELRDPTGRRATKTAPLEFRVAAGP